MTFILLTMACSQFDLYANKAENGGAIDTPPSADSDSGTATDSDSALPTTPGPIALASVFDKCIHVISPDACEPNDNLCLTNATSTYQNIISGINSRLQSDGYRDSDGSFMTYEDVLAGKVPLIVGVSIKHVEITSFEAQANLPYNQNDPSIFIDYSAVIVFGNEADKLADLRAYPFNIPVTVCSSRKGFGAWSAVNSDGVKEEGRIRGVQAYLINHSSDQIIEQRLEVYADDYLDGTNNSSAYDQDTADVAQVYWNNDPTLVTYRTSQETSAVMNRVTPDGDALRDALLNLLGLTPYSPSFEISYRVFSE